MLIIKKISDLGNYLNRKKAQKASIGFVPTMGALHKGHISLIETCKKHNTLCVASVFVNPTQFNNANDFRKYPVTIERDIDMLEEASCDILFLPGLEEIYPPGINAIHYDIGFLDKILEGKYRPGHFQGVCQVVDKLLSAVLPDDLYLGQKDYQQCLVIKQLINNKNYQALVHVCPVIREDDGLALSSRNMRLNETERQQATMIYKTLLFIKKELKPGNLDDTRKKANSRLEQEGFRIDYVEIADAAILSPLKKWDGRLKTVALIAAFVNEIRLIDNMELN